MNSPLIVHERLATVPVSKFLPELRFEFTDLPDQLFEWALLRTARSLAKDGGIIRRRVIIQTQCGVERYALRSPDGLEVNTILGIKGMSCCDCLHTVPRSFDPPDGCHSCAREEAWYDDQEQELHLISHCTPGIYFVSMSVVPADDACELPIEFYDDYIDMLLNGTRAKILRLNNKPWTNFQLADAYMRGVEENLREAIIEVNTHKMRGAVKINFGRAL